MASVKSMFANEFIQVDELEELEGKRMGPLTIAFVSEEDLGNREKLVLNFIETEKKLPLNKTNALACAEELGDDTDDWKNGTVIVTLSKTMFQGKRVPCLRLIDIKPGAAAVTAAAAGKR